MHSFQEISFCKLLLSYNFKKSIVYLCTGGMLLMLKNTLSIVYNLCATLNFYLLVKLSF